MPRSKRSKLVTLAQTDKKGRDNKDRIFDEVRTALDTYKYVWVLRLDDVRTPVLQEVRSDWVGSKLLMGKRKVIQKALGETPEEEYKQNLHEIVDVFEGLIGLLFTNEDVNTVSTYFESYKRNDFCRAKEKSPISFTIPAGIIYSTGGQISESEDVPLPHNLEPTFRNKYKVPTRIKAGKVVIDEPYKVCEKGDVLNVTQALILKQFGIASSEFKIQMLAYYDSEKEQVILKGEKKN